MTEFKGMKFSWKPDNWEEHLGELRSLLADMDREQLVDSAAVRGDLLLADTDAPLVGCDTGQVERANVRLLLERWTLHFLLVRRLRLRPSPRRQLLHARPLLHDMRTRDLVWRWLERLLRGTLHLLQGRRVGGHLLAALGQEACHRASVVASFHSALVLLALLLRSYRHRLVVRRHELLGALRDVRLLRHGVYEVPQVRRALRHLHHTGAIGADARGHVRDDQGCDVPECRPRVPRQQDQLCAGPRDVRELLRLVLQALHRELRDADAKATGWACSCCSGQEAEHL